MRLKKFEKEKEKKKTNKDSKYVYVNNLHILAFYPKKHSYVLYI